MGWNLPPTFLFAELREQRLTRRTEDLTALCEAPTLLQYNGRVARDARAGARAPRNRAGTGRVVHLAYGGRFEDEGACGWKPTIARPFRVPRGKHA